MTNISAIKLPNGTTYSLKDSISGYTTNTGTITQVKTTAGAHTTINVSSGAATFNVPTKTSHLTNDSGFLTSHQDLSGYIPRSGGAVLNGQTYSRTVDNDYLAINGSSTAENGAFLRLHGKNYDDTQWAGAVLIRTQNNSNTFFDLVLKPDGTLNWGGDIVILKNDPFIRRHVDNDFIGICGGTGWGQGGYIGASGKDRTGSESAGCVYIVPCDGTNRHWMHLHATGTWTWDGQAVQLTSDQRLKQQITQIDTKLLDAWQDVELVQFKYNDAVNSKGNTARLHTGYVVQQIDTACKSHNVDISDYGLYCHEEYPQETEEVEI